MSAEDHAVESKEVRSVISERHEEDLQERTELIAQADSLLKRLKLEAAAARAEARQAELGNLLAKARNGDASASAKLRKWLVDEGESPSSLTSGLDSARQTATARGSAARGNLGITRRSDPPHAVDVPDYVPRTDEHSPIGATERPVGDSPQPLNSQGTWDRLLPLAQSRIDARAAQLQESAADSESETSKSESETQVADGETFAERVALEHEDNPARQQALVEIASTLDSKQQEKQKQNHERILLFWGMRGVLASVLAHVLLGVILALVTLKLPSPPAGMAFESSSIEAAEETLELTQPLEAEITNELVEPVAADVSTLEAVDDMADLSSEMSDSTTELAASVMTSSAAAAESAVNASASAVNAAASFFGAAAGGNSFCYVIDGSGSMRGGPWEAAKLELLKSLASLKSSQRFYIIFFNRRLEAITLPGERNPAPRALYATHENLQYARRWVESLVIGVGAPPNKALALAIEKEPDAIYLLTDGVTKVDVAAFLREENRVADLIHGEQILVPIHTIAFYSLEGQQLLRQIARENRGQFVYVPDPRNR